MKRILSKIIPAVIFLITVFPHIANAQTRELKIVEDKGIEYLVTSDRTVEVITNESLKGNITVPESITVSGKTYIVNSLGAYAFCFCEDLISVLVPKTVENIHELAFTAIQDGEGGFPSCQKLAAINVDSQNPVYASADGVLYDKSRSTLLVAPRAMRRIDVELTVKRIDKYAFYDCSQLLSVHLPKSIDSIGEAAFANCLVLENIVLPTDLETIAPDTFNNCPNLRTVTLPSKLREIGAYAFGYCEKLSPVEFPKSLQFIGKAAFIRCDLFKTLYFPNSIQAVEESAFQYCKNMKEVSIPSSLTHIGKDAFDKHVRIIRR